MVRAVTRRQFGSVASGTLFTTNLSLETVRPSEGANLADEYLLIQVEACRRLAGEFIGRPERSFLLRVADAFQELAHRPAAAEPQQPLSRVHAKGC